MINIPPRVRVRSRPKKAGRNSHCVTPQGTKTASTNGAMTKNRAEPKTAITFDIGYSRTTGSAQPSSTSRCCSENRRCGRRVIRRFGDSYSVYHSRSELGAASHPNIPAVYDVGRHAGARYIISELLEGETLRERLTLSAPAPPWPWPLKNSQSW